MTDRINSLTVVLQREIREDDAEAIIQAISMIKGVGQVTGHVATAEVWAAKQQARWDLQSELREVLFKP